jgi:hypothetical protein
VKIFSCPGKKPIRFKPKNDDNRVVMQLPRGKFRSIKKGVPLGDILDEMATSRFSGICSFSSNTVNGTMVFKGGLVILAKVQDQYGDPAVIEARLVVDQVIDAVLSDLDGTQMQLALEFNKHAHVQKEGNWQGVSMQKAKSTPAQDIQKKRAPEPDLKSKPKEKDFIKSGPATPTSPAEPLLPRKEIPAEDLSGAREPPLQGQPASQEPQLSSAEKEFETFDSMDLEDVARKIRRDSKIILKQLDLDHLMEK